MINIIKQEISIDESLCKHMKELESELLNNRKLNSNKEFEIKKDDIEY